MNSSNFTAATRMSVKWLLLVVIAATIFYYGKFAAVPVHMFEAKPDLVVGEVMGTGTLEARVKTTISSRIQERLADMLVDQGDVVSAGQLLARLDDGEIQRQVEVAEAALAAAKFTAERVRVDEVRATAVEKQAQQEHKRISHLVATKVSSPAEMDKAVEQLHVAEADLKRARAATAETGQQVITAERNLDYHRERLTFAEIRSPYDGLITKRDRDPGGVVVPGSSVLQLIATNELWVSAWVDETVATALAPGQTGRIVFRSDPVRAYPGEVARLGRETDPETREFLVNVRVSELPLNWTIGQRAEVFVETARKSNALAVPQTCLQWRGGKPGVFVAENGKASWRDVTLGLRGNVAVEVMHGLSSGDKVVTPANPKQGPLKSGQRITMP
ncbi:MAG: efflux RND transporter periplasmic adaptor subunit [Verrucomicrobiae bacterium]|nr:efflux RND transporter periplasmic adaptor subunit [Verrucomicrobiae bacterium]